MALARATHSDDPFQDWEALGLAISRFVSGQFISAADNVLISKMALEKQRIEHGAGVRWLHDIHSQRAAMLAKMAAEREEAKSIDYDEARLSMRQRAREARAEKPVKVGL